MRSPPFTARATLRAATRHASSSGARNVFSEGERKPGASSRARPRFASTRAHKGSTSAFRASSETRFFSGSMSRHRANKTLPYANRLCFRHYTADTAVIGPSVSVLNQRAEVGQHPLDRLGRQGTPLPLLEGELSGVRLVQLEHLLHLGGEALGVDLQVYLVVAEEAVAVYVRRTDRGPDTVYGGGLGVDHDVPVRSEEHTSELQSRQYL